MSLRTQSISSMLVATLAACGGEAFQPLTHELANGASVRITVAPGTYSAGAPVPLAVSNLGDLEYIWNPCMRTLEHHTGLAWVALDDPDRVCTAEGWLLPSGKRTEAITDLAASLPAGEYRFRYGFSRAAGDYNITDQQVSNPFAVGP